MGFADIGTSRLRYAAREGSPMGEAHAARFGFTAPTLIYDKMRSIDASARSLDADWTAHVNEGDSTKAAWRSWLKGWRAFFDKTLGSDSAKTANLFHTDELRGTVDAYAVELAGWYETYKRVSGQSSSAPGAPSPMPSKGGGSEPEKTGFAAIFSAIPWWVYVVGTAFVGAVGYSFYKAAQGAKQGADRGMRIAESYLSAGGPGGGIAGLMGRDVPPVVINNHPPPVAPPAEAPPPAAPST